jgi:beta-glucosidase
MIKKLILLLLISAVVSKQGNAQTQFPFQNQSLTVEERVNDLVSRMTLQEKIMQLFNEAPAIERLGVPKYNWWNECLHGVARAGKATVFPQAIGMAATFDEKLIREIGEVVSDEARAKHHYFTRNGARSIYMGLTFWTPNINIFRDPRWGRGQETYGEDPFLTSRIAVNYIKGLQGEDPRYLKTIATAKHYAVHSGPEVSRHTDNIFVNDRDLYETYLPAFRASVVEANVQSVMCAYNRFRDKPCCGSDLLLERILRNDFGFKGYVVSDCGAITDLYKKENHGVVETPARAWGWTIASGTDLNCEESKAFVEDNIDQAIRDGIVNENDINVAVSRLFTARFRLGMFDNEKDVPFSKIPYESVGSPAHLDLTLKAAEKSLVLLKNDGILPLKKNAKVALIGPNAHNEVVLLANYNGDPIRPETPLVSLRERLGKNLIYTPGGPLVPGFYTDYAPIPESNFFHTENGRVKPGLSAEYFVDNELKNLAFKRIDRKIDFYWETSPVSGKIDEVFSVRWKGILRPSESGMFMFQGNVTATVDGVAVNEKTIQLAKGKSYDIEVVHKVVPFWWSSSYQQQFARLSWVNTSKDYKMKALAAAKQADVVVFCGGISANLEGEEMKLETDGFAHGDRTHIDLPSVQLELLKELYSVNKNLVYVNFSGSAVALGWQKENVPAIVQAFYPGEATGRALTRLLYGEFNPSGRLPVTFYKSVNDLPAFTDYRMEGRTYRYFKGEPLYPFGFGLSYTSFQYAELSSSKQVKAGTDLSLSVAVTNTGTMDGEEVIQVYVSQRAGTVSMPVRKLVHFERIFLKKGERKTVRITVPAERLAVVDENLQSVVLPGSISVSVGGGQPLAGAAYASAEIELTGDRTYLK